MARTAGCHATEGDLRRADRIDAEVAQDAADQRNVVRRHIAGEGRRGRSIAAVDRRAAIATAVCDRADTETAVAVAALGRATITGVAAGRVTAIAGAANRVTTRRDAAIDVAGGIAAGAALADRAGTARAGAGPAVSLRLATESVAAVTTVAGDAGCAANCVPLVALPPLPPVDSATGSVPALTA
jgi:hypothetical protein